MKNTTVAVVGLGYVGLPLALLARKQGYTVVGIDLNEEKNAQINKRISPIKDESLNKLLKRYKIFATSDFSYVKDVSTVIICVPTPIDENYKPDLSPVIGACKAIGKYLHRGQLVILESTVNPGVCNEIILPILEKVSGKICGKDFYLAHCPERINPGDKKWNVSNIPRVVGGFDKKSLAKALTFYRAVVGADIRPMDSLKEAESVKIIENSFRNVNIAFVNELAQSFDKLNIDVVNVIKGAATKPFAFMPHFPSCGVGGHCIPVDPYYLIEYAEKHGFTHNLLKTACSINNEMPKYTAEQVKSGLKEHGFGVKGNRVAVLGVAYKADVGDCRESPSFEIIETLKSARMTVAVFDPFVPEYSTVETLDEALDGAHAVVIATGHSLFKKLTPEYFISRGIKVIVDGQNCLDKSKFSESKIYYKGIGR